MVLPKGNSIDDEPRMATQDIVFFADTNRCLDVVVGTAKPMVQNQSSPKTRFISAQNMTKQKWSPAPNLVQHEIVYVLVCMVCILLLASLRKLLDYLLERLPFQQQSVKESKVDNSNKYPEILRELETSVLPHCNLRQRHYRSFDFRVNKLLKHNLAVSSLISLVKTSRLTLYSYINWSKIFGTELNPSSFFQREQPTLVNPK